MYSVRMAGCYSEKHGDKVGKVKKGRLLVPAVAATYMGRPTTRTQGENSKRAIRVAQVVVQQVAMVNS